MLVSYSLLQDAKLSFNKKLILQMRKKMIILLEEIAFKLKIFICQQSNGLS
jgi:hypothetical protein